MFWIDNIISSHDSLYNDCSILSYQEINWFLWKIWILDALYMVFGLYVQEVNVYVWVCTLYGQEVNMYVWVCTSCHWDIGLMRPSHIILTRTKNSCMRQSHEIYVLMTCESHAHWTHMSLRHRPHKTVSYNTYSKRTS